MATKDSDVNGEVFPCPIEWTVDEAEVRIKSCHELYESSNDARRFRKMRTDNGGER